MNLDEEHLRPLSIFHYVVGGLVALVGCFPFLHLFAGLALLMIPPDGAQKAPPKFLGLLFVVFAGCFILAFWALAGAIIYAGRSLVRRRRWLFCMIVAALCCAFFPFGTILGVFTIIVLVRPSVKALFEAQRPPDADERPRPV